MLGLVDFNVRLVLKTYTEKVTIQFHSFLILTITDASLFVTLIIGFVRKTIECKLNGLVNHDSSEKPFYSFVFTA